MLRVFQLSRGDSSCWHTKSASTILLRRIDADLASIKWGQAPLVGQSPPSLPAAGLPADAAFGRSIQDRERSFSPRASALVPSFCAGAPAASRRARDRSPPRAALARGA